MPGSGVRVPHNPLRNLAIVLTYFFLYPVGHIGLSEVTFFVSFPFIQVIVVNLAEITGVGVGVGVGVANFARYC